MLDATTAAWDWITERWAVEEPPNATALLVAAAVIAITTVWPMAWRLARNAVTIIHEMGHVVVARLTGRRIHGIKLHSDTSGLAVTSGKPHGLGVLLTALAGYLSPAAAGTGIVWAVYAGYSGAALVLLTCVLAGALLLSRNVYGVLITALALAGAIWALWDGNGAVITTTVLAAGLFLTVGGFRATLDLRHAHRKGRGASSDASLAARNSPLPAGAWVWVFIGLTSFAMVQALALAGTELLEGRL